MNDDQGRPEPEEIDLSLEDLEEEPEPGPVYRPPVTGEGGAGDEVLVITSDDLLEVDDELPTSSAPGAPLAGGGSGGGFAATNRGQYPAVKGGQYPVVSGGSGGVDGVTGDWGKATKGLQVLRGLLVQMAVAGAVGGLLAWLVTEPQERLHSTYAADMIAELYLSAMIFFSIIGGLIGLCLGVVEGISTANWRQALSGGLIGLGIGAVGGAVAGVLGQMAYSFLGGHGDRLDLGQLLARSVGWSIAGLFIGLGQGASGRSMKKVVNGLLGGASGGFIGGVLFDPIGALISGGMARLAALVVIGTASGAAIGLIEELRKEAWLLIVDGPLTGKQFILYRQQTTIGSSPHCDIALLKDHVLAPQQAVIDLQGGRTMLRVTGTMGVTYVNRQPAEQQSLRSGDIIQLGQTVFEYRDRTLPASNGPGGWRI